MRWRKRKRDLCMRASRRPNASTCMYIQTQEHISTLMRACLHKYVLTSLVQTVNIFKLSYHIQNDQLEITKEEAQRRYRHVSIKRMISKIADIGLGGATGKEKRGMERTNKEKGIQ